MLLRAFQVQGSPGSPGYRFARFTLDLLDSVTGKHIKPSFDYCSCAYANPSVPGTAGNGPSDKLLIVPSFITTVANPLVGVMNKRLTPVQILSRFLDDIMDPNDVVATAGTAVGGATLASVCGGAAATSALPLEDCVVVQKSGIARGRSFNKVWHLPGLNASDLDTTGDRISGTGTPSPQNNWKTAVAGFNQILSGAAAVNPCIISSSKSQLIVDPCTILGSLLKPYAAQAPWPAAGACKIDLELGEMKRRRQKRVGTF